MSFADELMNRLASRREKPVEKVAQKVNWPIEHDSTLSEPKKTLRFVVISDTHNRHDMLKLPEGDVLIHCGDMSDDGALSEITVFNEWLGTTPYKHRIVINGNHEVVGFC